MKQRGLKRLSLLFGIAVLSLSCGRFFGSGVRSFTGEPFPTKLSEWRLFLDGIKPNKGVVPYDLNTPLFSDYASKYRTIWMPTGTSATYRNDDVFDFPIGTVITKTFAFPAANS